MENKVKEKESKTDSIFLWPWCQRSKNQLGTEVGDKQEGNYRKFSGRRHHIFFLPAFRFDGKMERFGLAAFQKKCYKLTSSWHTLKCSSCTIHKAAWSNKQKNKRKKKKRKNEKASSVCLQNSGWKSNNEYLAYARGSLVHTEFNWHLALRSHHTAAYVYSPYAASF